MSQKLYIRQRAFLFDFKETCSTFPGDGDDTRNCVTVTEITYTGQCAFKTQIVVHLVKVILILFEWCIVQSTVTYSCHNAMLCSNKSQR